MYGFGNVSRILLPIISVIFGGPTAVASNELDQPINSAEELDLWNKGTIKWLTNIIYYNQTDIPALRVHNFNNVDGTSRTRSEIEEILNHVQTETLGNLASLLSLHNEDDTFIPGLINLKDYDLDGKDGIDWESSEYVVYGWTFSGNYNTFDYYYKSIKGKKDIPISLTTKINNFLLANVKYKNTNTRLYLNYIGETTKTAAVREIQHKSEGGSGSKVLNGICSTWEKLGLPVPEHSILYATNPDNYTEGVEGIDEKRQDRIKFVEALFATLCGRGTMNVMNCGWFYQGKAWWWRMFAYVTVYSQKEEKCERIYSSNPTCISLFGDTDESLLGVVYGKGLPTNVTIKEAWDCIQIDLREASAAAFNLANEKYGMDAWTIALLLGKHKEVKGNSLLARLTSIVEDIYENDMVAVMEAVSKIRSANNNVRNFLRSLTLAREGTGLSHGAARFILSLPIYSRILPGSDPVDRLACILETIYRNDLDAVVKDLAQKGRSANGRKINNNTSSSSSSSTNNNTSSSPSYEGSCFQESGDRGDLHDEVSLLLMESL